MNAEVIIKCKLNLKNLPPDHKKICDLIKNIQVDFLNLDSYIIDANVVLQSYNINQNTTPTQKT